MKITRRELRKIITETYETAVGDPSNVASGGAMSKNDGSGIGGNVQVRLFPSGFGTFGAYIVSGRIGGRSIFIDSNKHYQGKKIDINSWRYAEVSSLRRALEMTYGSAPPDDLLRSIKIDVVDEKPPPRGDYHVNLGRI